MQIEVPNMLLKSVKAVFETSPAYSHLSLVHSNQYVNTALNEFVRCKGLFMKDQIKEVINEKINIDILADKIATKLKL